jgi:hypothetical protein
VKYFPIWAIYRKSAIFYPPMHGAFVAYAQTPLDADVAYKYRTQPSGIGIYSSGDRLPFFSSAEH